MADGALHCVLFVAMPSSLARDVAARHVRAFVLLLLLAWTVPPRLFSACQLLPPLTPCSALQMCLGWREGRVMDGMRDDDYRRTRDKEGWRQFAFDVIYLVYLVNAC